MKIDPYHNREKYFRWKDTVKAGIPGLRPENSSIILQYLFDMENGLNVSSNSTKGPRSYIRLINLKQRMIFLAKQFEQHYHCRLVDMTEQQLVLHFNAMRNGTIRKQNGQCYQSVIDYVKAFKAFWHWYIKVNRKQGVPIPDITEDLDVSKAKPHWVYLNEERLKQLVDHAKPKYKTLIMFLYDSGIRSPTELLNVRVNDLSSDCRQLNIRQETAKKGTFGRRINLMLCSDLIRKHIMTQELSDNDQLFSISPTVVNRYLKRLAQRVLGDGVSLAGEKYSNLTMYDFRHCSCCYWLPRYKSESALKYRFGWKKSDKIHYYSELLGMKDTITEEDLLMDISKTEIERRLVLAEQKNTLLQERLEAYSADVSRLKSLMQQYLVKLSQQEAQQRLL